jgi:hypothetical protein
VVDVHDGLYLGHCTTCESVLLRVVHGVRGMHVVMLVEKIVVYRRIMDVAEKGIFGNSREEVFDNARKGP